jgi:hypothetical protein
VTERRHGTLTSDPLPRRRRIADASDGIPGKGAYAANAATMEFVGSESGRREAGRRRRGWR